VSGFDTGQDEDELLASEPAAKRRKTLAREAEAARMNQRATAWVTRGERAEDEKLDHRPATLYRVKAKQFCAMIDHQVQLNSPLVGLAHYIYNPDDARWNNWRTWNHLMLSLDLGAPGSSGSQAMLYKYSVCLTKVPDPDHSCLRALLQALKEVHLYEFIVLMLVVWNFVNGPQDNDYRYHQLRGAAEKVMKTFTWLTNKHFQEHAPNILEEMREAGVELPGNESPDKEAYDYWCQRQSFRRKKDKVMMGRFCQFTHRMEHELQWWTMDLYEREVVGIELDMFKSAKFCRRMIKTASLDIPEGGLPTSSKVLTVDDKAIRSCADTALLVSVAMLSQPSHHRLCEIIMAQFREVMSWRTMCNKDCRDPDTSRQFLVAQACGGFQLSLKKHWDVLVSRGVLERMRFVFPSEDRPVEEAEIVEDDEYAMVLWDLAASIHSSRGGRGLYWTHMPLLMSGVLKSAAHAGRILDEFQNDTRIFEDLSKVDAPGRIVKAMRQRHLFQTKSVEQYNLACKEVGYDRELNRDFAIASRNGQRA